MRTPLRHLGLGALAASLLTAVSLAAVHPAPAAATGDPRPGISETWPMCGVAPDTDGKYCVVSQTKNGTTITHPDSGRYQRPEIDLIGDGAVRFGVIDYQDGVPMEDPPGTVDGDVPPGDVYSITVNTGDIVPRELYGNLRNVTYTTGGDATSGYTFTMTFQPTPFAWVDPSLTSCTIDGCGDDTTVADWVYDGFVTGYVTDLRDWPASEQAMRTGFVRAYNAQDADVAYSPTTNSLVVRLANPHLKAPGQVATGSYETFIPDAMLTGWLEVPDPAGLTGGSFVVSRSAGGGTTSVPFTLTHRPGGVAIEITGITYSTPTYRIKPKRTAPGAPRFRAMERLSRTSVRLHFRAPIASGGSPVTSYQARCRQPDGDLVRSSGDGSPLRVDGVGRASVTCSVRAVNRIGAGDWSSPRSG